MIHIRDTSNTKPAKNPGTYFYYHARDLIIAIKLNINIRMVYTSMSINLLKVLITMKYNPYGFMFIYPYIHMSELFPSLNMEISE